MMNYNVEYAALCHIGKVRARNQDNFWCMGAFMKSENNGLAEPISNIAETRHSPVFAVFDGMGGEQQGEVAAYIAAYNFNDAYNGSTKADPRQFLLASCIKMNKAICEYAAGNHIRSTGTTAAILMFGAKKIYVCNIGDSRIYQYNGKRLVQISHDHSIIGVTDRKPPLSQNLGIPETEFLIEPYVDTCDYRDGDKYLICSDGLTDMASDREIEAIIRLHSGTTDGAKALVQKALDSGGGDNITVILCEVNKRKRVFGKTIT